MVYKWYILPIGGLYATYHLLGEPETTIDENEKNPMIFSPNLVAVMETGCTVLLRGRGYGKAMLPGRSLSPGAIDNVYCMWYPPPKTHTF